MGAFLTKKVPVLILLFFTLLCHQWALGFNADSGFANVESLVSSHQYGAGLDTLSSFPIEELSEQDQLTWAFGSGILHFREHRWAEAKQAFQKTLAAASGLEAIVYYHLGLVDRNLGHLKSAQAYLNKALNYSPSKVIRYQVRMALGELAIARKHYVTAYKHYRYLQRRWKWSDQYPLILRRLVEVDLARKKRWRACRWARNLYRNFPAHQAASNWGIDLQNVEIGNQKLGCLASFNDQKRRIRRLQWSGQSPKARTEIDILIQRSSSRTKYSIDQLLANFLMNEGYVDEAVQVLLKYHKTHSGNFDYMMLLGRATSKAGRFQSAVGSYTKAHSLRKRASRDAREALFKAAFLSYQFQDYDGAYRKFKKLKDLYPSSYRARDARWHMAWLKYLREDYKGAIADFKTLYSLSKRRWRYRKNYPLDRIQYWMAMSYYRDGQPEMARVLFGTLIKNNQFGYYAQAAKHRLSDLPSSSGAPIRDLAEAEVIESQVDDTPLMTADNSDSDMTSEAADEVKGTEAEASKDLAENEVPVDDSEGIEEEEENQDNEAPIFFKSKKLQARFERAKRLIRLGFYDWARWELYTIEQKTRNKDYRKNLAELFQKIKSYNRSAYIASIYFGEERRKGGMAAEEQLWKAAYPLAFENIVNHFSSEFGIEREFVWAIMRAESFFKADISSPVGAKGLMQLMPHTASQVSRLLGDEAFDTKLLTRPEVNVRVGTRYLQRLSKKFKGQIPLMAAGYNAGPHRVKSWLSNFGHLEMDEFIEHIPFKETRKYVKKVTRNYAIYKQLYAQELNSVAWINKAIDVPPNIQHTARETWEKL
jgi:soluble lytic murein transglycosylase